MYENYDEDSDLNDEEFQAHKMRNKLANEEKVKNSKVSQLNLKLLA